MQRTVSTPEQMAARAAAMVPYENSTTGKLCQLYMEWWWVSAFEVDDAAQGVDAYELSRMAPIARDMLLAIIPPDVILELWAAHEGFIKDRMPPTWSIFNAAISGVRIAPRYQANPN
ncbi:hypothetical protein AB4Z48_26530 [Cupriavidus sp. 2TAF22]|uniref:hypothetical protein n=1 Tax=unclassified Cupriavidus TaxID=2640874 RepID=UPI003F8F70F2